jgi:hypothetical protein
VAPSVQEMGGGTPARTEKSAGREITKSEAVAACRAFFRKIGMAVPAGSPDVSRMGKAGGKTVRTYYVVYTGMAHIIVRGDTGDIAHFTNAERGGRRLDLSAPTKPLRLKDRLVARAYVERLMEKIGMDGNCKIVLFECRFGSELGRGGLAKPPRVKAQFQTMPHGYRLHDNDGKYGISVDPTDGTVTSYAHYPTWPYTILSHEVVLTWAAASEKARPIVVKNGVGRPRAMDPGGKPMPATHKSELMFVRPNGEMGGATTGPKKPVVFRLAWVLVYAQDDEVWIDAADGSFLGGIHHGYGRYQ